MRNSSNAWKSDGELSMEVRRRFFSNSDAGIKTGDKAGDFGAHRNPVWTDHAGRPLIAKFEDDVTVKTTVSGKNAIAAANFFGEKLGLGNNNWYSAEVSVKLADVPNFKPFDTIGLTTTRRTVLLADSWTARSNAQIRTRIEDGGFAVYPIGEAETLVNLIGKVPPEIYDPALVVGNFDWDVVPCDRLVGGC